MLQGKEKYAAKNYVIRNYKPDFNYTNMLYASPMAYSYAPSPNRSEKAFWPTGKSENRLNSFVNDLTEVRIEEYKEKLDKLSKNKPKK